MASTSLHHPSGNRFDRFLYATVGEDRNGYVVTVLSTLARLGLDPWKEASELGALSPDVARSRIGTLLSGFRDVPALGLEHGAVAARLALLLPERLSHRVSKAARPAISRRSPISIGWIFVVFLVGLVLARFYFLAHSG